jgi:L-lysine 6-transaminase
MKRIDPKKVIEVLNKSILADGFDMVLDLNKSKGARLYDSKNNRTLLDFFSFFASNPIGINHPRLSEKAFEEKLLRYAKTKVSNSDIYTTAYAEFVSSFHKNAAPMFDRFFFIDGGALGVENAIKTAQDWKVRKNLAAGKGEKGTQVLHFKEAFHGRTGYTLSLTNTAPEKILYFPKFDWPRVTNPKIGFPLTEESLRSVEALEKRAVKEIEEAFQRRPDEICSIIIETIQGEGGDNFFRAEFLQKLRELADTYDALLIFDEVQTGMGLTGKFWAFEHFKVLPDLIAFGKKSQVCGCAARLNKLREVDHVFKVSSRINSTFGGNLVDMVRTTQFIDIILEENLLRHVSRMGAEIKKELEALSAKYDAISAVRGLGLWMAFDLPTPEMRNEFLDLCWKNGLVVLACGTKTVRIRPILDLKQDEAEEGLRIFQKSLEELLKISKKRVGGRKS